MRVTFIMWTPSFWWQWVRTVVSVEPMLPNAGESIPLEKVRQWRSRVAPRLTVRPRVRFAPSLAAALLDGLFEYPAETFVRGPGCSGGALGHLTVFSAFC